MYTNITEMLARYEEQKLIELTDFEAPYQDTIIEDVLNKVISDASAEVDLYLGGRYDLPLSQTPAALVDMTCTIVYYRLHRERYTDTLRQEYDDVIKTLEKISMGKIKLNMGGEEPKSAAAIAKVSAPDRIFNRDSLKGW